MGGSPMSLSTTKLSQGVIFLAGGGENHLPTRLGYKSGDLRGQKAPSGRFAVYVFTSLLVSLSPNSDHSFRVFGQSGYSARQVSTRQLLRGRCSVPIFAGLEEGKCPIRDEFFLYKG